MPRQQRSEPGQTQPLRHLPRADWRRGGAGSTGLAAPHLAASIAHEVRQPLTAVVLHGEAALRRLDGAGVDAQPIRAELLEMVDGALRANRLLACVLSLARRDAPTDEVDLSFVIRDSVARVTRELVGGRVKLVLEVGEGLPLLRGDAMALEVMTQNLLRNAIEAMAASRGERLLAVRAERADEGGVVMEVSDTGPGVEPCCRHRLFEPYVTTKPSGTGLGLALCRAILERHGGQIEVLSPAGGGTRVHVRLPHQARGFGAGPPCWDVVPRKLAS